MHKTVRLVVVGCGNRGSRYASIAKNELESGRCEVVAACDPKQTARDRIQKMWELKDECVFPDWREFVAKFDEEKKLSDESGGGRALPQADAVVVSTLDELHVEPVIAFAERGFHVLLEKPMATTEEDCRRIVDVTTKAGVILVVCHVLRYSPAIRRLKEIIESKEIGEVCNVQHMEPVGFWHYAHSYVRGNWRKEAESSFVMMTKCCHDFDLLRFLISSSPKRISSFGSLKVFNKSQKPAEAGDATRCLQCPLKESCAYSSKRIYLDPIKDDGYAMWPVTTVSPLTREMEEMDKGEMLKHLYNNVTDALETGPYGVCAYESDNDVMDNQVVSIQFENGATATLTMVAFSETMCKREINIFASNGEIRCDSEHITVRKFSDGSVRNEFIEYNANSHGGGDDNLLDKFVTAIATNDTSHVTTGPTESLLSHLMVFAAEKSRLTSNVVELHL